jgi:protein-S-isoprenylcysteine O-methyltransferase Ste14
MAVLTLPVAVRQAISSDDDVRREAARERLSDFVGRAAISAWFVVFAVKIGAEFLRTGHLTGLLLLASELLVVVFTVVRRPAVRVDRAWMTRAVAMASMVGIPLLRPIGVGIVPDAATAAVSAAGLLLLIAGKVALGRSFGLMPANRGIVCRGVYRLMRHPIYAGYLVTHAAFLVAHPTGWNLVVLVASDTALVVRAIYEERMLARDPAYASYMTTVRWRVLPGVF